MNKIKNNDEDDEDGEIIKKSTDFDAVKIMTIHASKGLEFPVVISPSGFKGPKKNVVTYIYKESNQKYLGFKNNNRYKEEQMQECMRLFYVDYTRASYLLIIPIYIDQCGTGKPDDLNANHYLMDKLREFRQNSSNIEKISLSSKKLSDYRQAVSNVLSKSSKKRDRGSRNGR